jgi:hypothetical protein
MPWPGGRNPRIWNDGATSSSTSPRARGRARCQVRSAARRAPVPLVRAVGQRVRCSPRTPPHRGSGHVPSPPRSVTAPRHSYGLLTVTRTLRRSGGSAGGDQRGQAGPAGKPTAPREHLFYLVLHPPLPSSHRTQALSLLPSARLCPRADVSVLPIAITTLAALAGGGAQPFPAPSGAPPPRPLSTWRRRIGEHAAPNAPSPSRTPRTGLEDRTDP